MQIVWHLVRCWFIDTQDMYKICTMYDDMTRFDRLLNHHLAERCLVIPMVTVKLLVTMLVSWWSDHCLRLTIQIYSIAVLTHASWLAAQGLRVALKTNLKQLALSSA